MPCTPSCPAEKPKIPSSTPALRPGRCTRSDPGRMIERVLGIAVVGYALWVILHRKRQKARPEYESPQLQGIGTEKPHTQLGGFLIEEDARQFVGQSLASPYT